MDKRIKLTEYDLRHLENHELTKQILGDQDIAEKSGVYKDFYDKWHLTLQENKQLKETKQILINDYDAMSKKYLKVEQKLEKIKEIVEDIKLSADNLTDEVTSAICDRILKEILDSQEKE